MIQCSAAVVREPGGAFGLEDLVLEPPRAGEVLVRIAGVGLCHTDLVFRDQFAPYPLPAVLGHEGAGVIEAVGPGVDGLAVGDRVVIGFSSCGHCRRCGEGLPGYCREFTQLNYAGGRLEDGSTALSCAGERVASHFFGQSSFASHAVARARNVVRVGDTAAPLELLGPLGCGFQTGAGSVMRALACEAGSTLAVFGGGPVGLAAVMGAAIQACGAIVLVEPVAARRELGRELGATQVIDPAAGDVLEALRAAAPQGFDYVLDTTGDIRVIETGFEALSSYGLLGLVGVPKRADARVSFNLAQAITFGRRVVGVIEGDSDPHTFIPELLAHHAAGRFSFERLVKTFPLTDINAAIAAQAAGECVKAVLLP